MPTVPGQDDQPLLFDSLPQDRPSRRSARRAARAAADRPARDAGVEVARSVPESVPEVRVVPTVPAVPAVAAVIDPAALSNPELADLIIALSDVSLSFLLIEAVREVRRRLSQPEWADADADAEGEGEARAEPNPSLLRAARRAVTELTEAE